MNHLTIVMYHYVREIKGSRFPQINGLELKDFKEQLAYLKRHYEFVTVQDCITSLKGKDALPSNAILLTFDDGYSDHFQNVFPILQDMGIQGSFFPPAQPILEGKVLDVNKIHFILCSADPKKLVDELFKKLEGLRREGYEGIPSEEEILTRSAHYELRYDSKEVTLFKRLLQRDLPLAIRATVTDELFRKFVSNDERAFARELYMNLDNLRTMQTSGMYAGSHGWSHSWLDSVSPEIQKLEIDKSLEFLKSVGAPTDDWVMCYPYGAFNQSLVKILANSKCALALTTQVGIATLDSLNALTLKRLDTNDFPKSSKAPSNCWTQLIYSH
jgi:peptidoglycan/xylan/chitin deacetylase (PgdA/CDA1 family)